MVSVFLISCEQESIIDDNLAEEVVMENEPSQFFQIPESENMTEEDVIKLLGNLNHEEMKTIGETIDKNEIEFRGCGSWSGWVTYNYVADCNGCGNQAKHTSYKYRYRRCSWGWHTQYTSSYVCKTYC